MPAIQREHLQFAILFFRYLFKAGRIVPDLEVYFRFIKHSIHAYTFFNSRINSKWIWSFIFTLYIFIPSELLFDKLASSLVHDTRMLITRQPAGRWRPWPQPTDPSSPCPALTTSTFKHPIYQPCKIKNKKIHLWGSIGAQLLYVHMYIYTDWRTN